MVIDAVAADALEYEDAREVTEPLADVVSESHAHMDTCDVEDAVSAEHAQEVTEWSAAVVYANSAHEVSCAEEDVV